MADVPHQHPGDERSSYYLDQLFMIGVCGAVAAVTIMLWRSGSLNTLLHEKFALAVGAGGLGLLALVILRAISVWTSVDTHAEKDKGHVHGPDCDHGHGHDHSHSHGHGHEGHSHGHEPPAPPSPAPGPASGGAMSLALAPSAAGPVPSAAPAPAAAHSHAHSHSHSHSHAHGDHSHGGAPWRYIVLLLPVVLYFLVLSQPSFNREPIDKPADPLEHIQNFILVFRSILWEALPFIILGAIIAGLLEEFLPQRVLTAIVPKNPFVAICMGGLLGLIFPMCECGIIPIMRRLLRKGLPLSCCVAYLLAGPIINVVVILSTMAAFSGMENTYVNGKPAYQMGSLWMTAFRVGLGYVVAVITGMIVEWQHRKHGDSLLTPLTRPNPNAADDDTPTGPSRPLWERIGNVTETALGDFVDITVFLILGALLSATVRIFIGPEQIATLSGDPEGSLLSINAIVAIVLMMGLAIALCLCSEADAFVAASFSTLRPSAKLAFLVLGPMLDFKLYAMYTRIFRPRLTFTIYGAVLAQVFVYSVGVHAFWEKFGPQLVNPQQKHLDLSEDEQRSVRERLDATVRVSSLVGSVGDPAAGAWLAPVVDLSLHPVKETYEAPPEVSFLRLESATTNTQLQQYYEGKVVRMTGRFMSTGNDKVFSLLRYKMNCCAADATPLRAPIFVDDSQSKEKFNGAPFRERWVEVTASVHFEPGPGGATMATLRVTPTPSKPLSELVKGIQTPANPYVY